MLYGKLRRGDLGGKLYVTGTCTRAPWRAAWAVLFAASLLLAVAGQAGNAHGATDGASYYSQAQAAEKRGDYRTAVLDFEQAIVHGHNDPGSYYQLGLAFKQTKQMNYAEWAMAKALSDPAFSAANPSATKELEAIEQSGVYDSGPPAALRHATMAAGTAVKTSPAILAQQEAQSAFSIFQDPQQAYYVSPGFASRFSLTDLGQLEKLADDAGNQSNTTVKVVFLDAVPAPYVQVADYAHDLLTRLALQSGIVVVVTPQQAGAASNRLDSGSVSAIVAQQVKTTGLSAPVQLAANIGQTILQRADDENSTSDIRSVIAGILAVLIVLAVLAWTLARILRRTPPVRENLQRPYGRVAAQKKSR